MKLKKSDTVPVMENALLDLITRIASSRSEPNFLVTRANIVLWKRSKIKCTSGHKPPKGYSIPRELPV